MIPKKLQENDQITASRKTERCLQSFTFKGTNNSDKFRTVWLNSQSTSDSFFKNLLQVCSSVPSFCIAELLKPPFNVLSGYFYVSPVSVANFPVAEFCKIV